MEQRPIVAEREKALMMGLVTDERVGWEPPTACSYDPAAIIFTMSGRDEDFQEVATRLGAKKGFRKPVAIAELLDAVRSVAGKAPRRA